ncbi:hypothetical protein A0H81_08153 [Grifola frondosa]|uniref:DinB-like domain-containing protein n=1 Tax=Grifola frondosa TaxID=5627 RepID=A0A1C7M4W6_GRIFR|nr:hypothetical protein A0H81_08153 [Grifola frondosa]
MSTSSASSLSSPSLTPSTAPSTPVHSDSPTVYCLILHNPSSAFLKALPIRCGGNDRVLLFNGTGPVKALLSRASEVISDKALLDVEQWESFKEQDDGSEVVYYRSKTAVSKLTCALDTVDFDNLHVQTSVRTDSASLNLFADASLRAVISLQSAFVDPQLTLHILERPALTFPLLSRTPCSALNPTAHPYGMPSLSSFQDGWAAWDLITLGMIPPSLLHSKPIDLRHKPLFYLGHLPTFLNLLLTAHLRESPVPPARFTAIFERGIDPHVDDPDYCHPHSEVPIRDEDWPALPEVLAYRDRVRERLIKLYEELEAGTRVLTRRLVRTLVMILEHDGFHIETLLYILIQRSGSGMLPPPGFASPPWAHLAEQWDVIPAPTTPRAVLGPSAVVMGHDDQEPDDLLPEHERPLNGVPSLTGSSSRSGVERARAVWDMPISWVEEDGEIKVRTLYGPIAMKYAQHWPVLTSYDDFATYASSKGGRIPTEPELRLFLDTYQIGYEEGANTGFRNWHPMPATAGGSDNKGRGSNGGVWEWSSTTLASHEGFEGTTIFPGYSSDFFDPSIRLCLVPRMPLFRASEIVVQSVISISTIILIHGLGRGWPMT